MEIHHYIVTLNTDHQKFADFFLEIYLSFGISLSNPKLFASFVTVPEILFGVVLEIFIILSVIFFNKFF